MSWNRNVYRVFDTLRFPLVVLIVFLHLKGEPHNMQINWYHFGLFDGYNMLRIYVSCIICNIAVPLFFLMSGYLFYHKVGDITMGLYLEKIIRRVKTLCIPYLFWISIFLVGNVIMIIRSPECISVYDSFSNYFMKFGAFKIYWDCYVLGGGEPPIGLVQDNSAPLLIPMWFVRDLFIVSLFSPLLWWLNKKKGVLFLSFLAICYVFQFWPYIHGVSSVSFFFFSMGIFMSRHSDNLDEYFNINGLNITIITLCLSFLLIYLININWPYTPYVMRVFMIIGSFTALFLVNRIVQSNINLEVWQKLSKASFTVYAMHMVFVSKYVRIFVRRFFVFEDSLPYLFVEYIMVPIITISISLLFYYIIRRFFPKALFFISGGR